jgi:hypothetical protein
MSNHLNPLSVTVGIIRPTFYKESKNSSYSNTGGNFGFGFKYDEVEKKTFSCYEVKVINSTLVIRIKENKIIKTVNYPLARVLDWIITEPEVISE